MCIEFYWQIDFVQQPLLSFFTQTTRWYLLHLATNLGGHLGLNCTPFLAPPDRFSRSAESAGAAMSVPNRATDAIAAISTAGLE